MISQKQRQNNYWQMVIKQIELNALKKNRRDRIKNYDFYLTLPKNLHQRVAKIIPLEYSDEFPEQKPQHKAKSQQTIKDDESVVSVKKTDFNESTCSIVERKEDEFPKFDLNLENVIEKKSTREKRHNWYSGFICAQRKDRVKWKSKIYQMEKSIWEKPLDEQAEQLMDASAERFTDWVNNLGSKSEKDMTKEQLKSLFSIEGNAKLLASIQTDPKEVKAIAKTVADRWNLPEMAIELKYESYITANLKTAPKKARTVAFGKTIPYKERPWIRADEDVSIETVFPDELRNGEHLFKGISHLRSTKALIEYCNKKPNIPRPKYLVENGYFNVAAKRVSDGYVPLYELLKIK
ncbi:uncharacterized protein LOC129912245 [Episyrphus balteatus]|uniref:uncharacterized protein LOC129912245 n=1 Tax=Episyrphus balteatus TaxID=286459 RepID=UPI0024854FA4|nr:uncharacterized protein LOC129912245 [Episyrphus balteatus]